MNWQELKSYVNEAGRTRAQHERVARTIGVNPDAKGNLLLHNINRRIEARIKSEGPEAISGFTPPNNRTTNHSPQRQRAPRNQNPPVTPQTPIRTLPNRAVRVVVTQFSPKGHERLADHCWCLRH